jgi:hypothetical protein
MGYETYSRHLLGRREFASIAFFSVLPTQIDPATVGPEPQRLVTVK